ncbi:MAG: hypothetical protein HY231_06775 [Acidobacteria bacterium]|nr:hypothetical protein [Acidobacteriota bacterium]
MKGIQFVSDDKGQKVAVLIDLQKYGKLWEDFYDSLVASLREKEPRESLESVRKRLVKTKEAEWLNIQSPLLDQPEKSWKLWKLLW